MFKDDPKYKRTGKTNDQMLMALAKNLDAFEAGLLRERITSVMAITMKSIEENPEKWENGFINPSLYVHLNKKIQKYIGYGEEETAKP